MIRYELLEYYAGATVEVVRHIPKRYRKGAGGLRRKKGKEEIDRANYSRSVRKLVRKINANFRPGDWHIILTYRKDARPDRKEVPAILKKFFDSLRAKYKKAGEPMKYIVVTECEARSIHHHLIINDVNGGKGKTTKDFVLGAWKGRGNPKFVSLYDTGDYRMLAEYLIKETARTRKKKQESGKAVKQLYSCSRNLTDPKPKRKACRVKRGWSQQPKPRKGYYIDQDTLYNGCDKAGYPYQRYTMIKIDPKPEDWETPGGGKEGKRGLRGKHRNRRKPK